MLYKLYSTTYYLLHTATIAINNIIINYCFKFYSQNY